MHHEYRRILTYLTAPLLAAVALTSLGSPASALTLTPTTDTAGVTKLGWSVVGLDSNNVNVGPNEFSVGARFCASAPASGVTATWQWLSGGTTTNDTYIRLSDTSTSYQTIAIGSLAASNCFDAYWNVKLTRDAAAFEQSRAYQITFRDGGGNILGATDNRQRIYVERLLSQYRNTAGTLTLAGGGTTLMPGQVYDFHVTGSTASSFGQLSFASIFPAQTFQLLSAEFHVMRPNGHVDQIYADACTWVSMYEVQGEPGACVTHDGAGGDITAHFRVRVLPNAAPGTVDVRTLVYDYSGSSFHYNGDFGDSVRTFTIGSVPASTVTITYFANAGTDTVTGMLPTPDTVSVGSSYTVESPTLSRTNGVTTYALLGWNTQPNGTGVPYALGSVITASTNLSLYAIWAPNSYCAVSYNLMGGTGGPETTTLVLTTESITVGGPSPTLAGYTFLYWTATANGTGETFTAGSKIVCVANMLKILYAQYTGNQVALTYHANGGVGADFVDTYTVGAYTIKTTAATGISRTGYTFTGWNTAANGSGTMYQPGAMYTGHTLTHLYAQWAQVPANQYTVTYFGNGNTAGAAPLDARLYLPGETATLLGRGTLARVGHDFIGWTMNADGSGTLLQPGAVITIGSSNVLLYARWMAQAPPSGPTMYALTVNIVGSGTVSPDTRTFLAGVTETLTATPATGWYFVGWSGDCTGASLTCAVTMNAPKTVTATFAQGVTILTAVQGSGTVSSTVPVGTVVPAGTVTTLVATPATGWQFSGWTGDCAGSTTPLSVTLNVSKQCTAVFTETAAGPQAPTAVDDRYAVRMNKVLRVGAAAGVLSNDGTSVTGATLVSKTKHGKLRLSVDGSFVYTPNKGFRGSDSFTYKATDAAGASVNAVARITVTKAPKAPRVITSGR